MSIFLRIILILSSILFLFFVIYMIRNGKYLLKYSFMWLLLGILGVLAALFPAPIIMIAGAFGFEAASNFLFFGCAVLLLTVSLIQSSINAKQAKQIKRLIQEVSILKNEVNSNTQDLTHDSDYL